MEFLENLYKVLPEALLKEKQALPKELLETLPEALVKAQPKILTKEILQDLLMLKPNALLSAQLKAESVVKPVV